jgi:hypothetical protein
MKCKDCILAWNCLMNDPFDPYGVADDYGCDMDAEEG